jgi:monooxygenase
MAVEYFDVLIMGAGLSGIDAAHHLQKFCPKKSYVILEQRERIGGTWDLFRYPGIRSDSDMLTMGYSFRPWTSPKAISPGDDIRDYIAAAARDEGIDRHIRFRHRIRRAAWSSARGAVDVDAVRKLPDGREEPVTLTATSCSRARAITAIPRVTRRSFRISAASRAASFTRKPGPRIWTTPESAWSSSAAAPPP